MKIARYELKVVYKKELILMMEDDVDSEDLLKIFLETQLKEEKEQSELLGIIAEKVSEESCTEQCESCQKYCPASEECMANNGVQMVGVQVRLQEENVCPVVYVEPFFNEIRLGEPVEKVMNEIAKCMEEAGNAPFVHNGINPMDYDSVKEHLAVMLAIITLILRSSFFH